MRKRLSSAADKYIVENKHQASPCVRLVHYVRLANNYRFYMQPRYRRVFDMDSNGAPGVMTSPDSNVILAQAAPLVIDFLRQTALVSQQLRRDVCLRRAVHRYASCWLPMLARWRDSLELEPPLDVHWVWYLHLLQPAQYAQYCRERFGKILNHRLRKDPGEARQAHDRTKNVWADFYPNEPFVIDLSDEFVRQQPPSASAAPDSQLLQSIMRMAAGGHADFIYQVSLPHYTDPDFLAVGEQRYWTFVRTPSMWKDAAVAPPFDVQLMWRTHILHPAHYYFKIQSAGGIEVFERALKAGSTEEGEGLAFRVSDAWKAIFREELFIPGTGYRGPIHIPALTKAPSSLMAGPPTTKCELAINDITVTELVSDHQKIVIEARLIGSAATKTEVLFKVAGKMGETISLSNVSSAQQGRTQFDAQLHRGIEFSVYGRRGFACFGSEEKLTTMTFHPLQQFLDGEFHTNVLAVTLPRASRADPKFSFRCAVQAEQKRPHVFALERSDNMTEYLPGDILNTVAGQPTWSYMIQQTRQPTPVVGRHRLKRRHDDVTFDLCVMTLPEHDLNVVTLRMKQQLLAMAYTIGVEHLPKREQVSARGVISMEMGDTAMVIRNSAGDWAICVAKWNSDDVNDNPETNISMRIHWLQDRTKKEVEFTINEDELRTIAFDDVLIDLPTGRITVAGNSPALPETLALAVCVGVLYVTCQRRTLAGSQSTKSYKSIGGTSLLIDNSSAASISKRKVKVGGGAASRKNRRRTQKRKMSASFTFLLACGLQVDVLLPSARNTISRADANGLAQGQGQNGGVDSKDINPYSNGNAFGDGSTDNPDRYRDVKL